MTKRRRLWRLEPARPDGPVLEVLVAEVPGTSDRWWSLGLETPHGRGHDEVDTLTALDAAVRPEVAELLTAAPRAANVGYPAWLARRVHTVTFRQVTPFDPGQPG